MMQKLALAAAVLIMGLVLAQPAATAVTPTAARAAAKGTVEQGADPRMWRGKEPNMCLVRECEGAEPTFCLIETPSAADPMRPRFDGKRLCDQQPGFRDALRGRMITPLAPRSLRQAPRR